jgi:hypothetical protein
MTNGLLFDVEAPPHARRVTRAHGLRGFDRFWQTYPRKCAKQRAERAFRRLSPDAALLDQICAAVEVQKRQYDWRKEGGKYIPYPATWLNDRRWEDVDVRRDDRDVQEAGDWWYEECGRLHQHTCSGRYGHHLRMGAEDEDPREGGV